MLFNSLPFLVFLPAVVALYYLLPHRFRWAWLLAASIYFYGSFIPAYLFILFALIGIDYMIAIFIEDQPDPRRRKALLLVGIIFDLALLFVFKYFNFANENLEALAHFIGWNYQIATFSLILPLGLSFHTFQALSYLIDVYGKRQKAERHLGIFALFVMFFPQLVAGPIERASHLLPQFHQEHRFTFKSLTSGLVLLIAGFFLKLVIADRAALIVNTVYHDPSLHGGPAVLLTLILFAFQLYGDFAGYTLIALGSARMLGFQLVENFARPYLSRSVAEFWRRWHISLSEWLRDYVHLGVAFRLRRRISPEVTLYSAVIVTFLASGLWHGAGWNFVFMGLFFGVVIVIEHATNKVRMRLARTLGLTAVPWLSRMLATSVTFALVLFGWMLFRSPSLSVAGAMLSRLTTGWSSFLHTDPLTYFNGQSLFGYRPAEVLLTIVFCAALMIAEILLESERFMRIFNSSRYSRVFVYSFLTLAILAFGQFSQSVFIYFQF